MSLSIEAILADAQKLVVRLKEHDTTADCLIARTQSLHKQFDAMKQFQDYLNDLNDAARHRPRIGLIITLAQENSKIRELQQENKELRESLDEHQSALELIMSKYREQVDKLMKANSVERSLLQQSLDQSQDLEIKSLKISEMAAVMNRAASIDGHVTENNLQLIKDLEYENHVMRQLLQIDSDIINTDSAVASLHPTIGPSIDIDTQTDDSIGGGCTLGLADDDDPFCLPACSTVVRNPRHSTCTVSDAKSKSEEVGQPGSVENPSSLTTVDSDKHSTEPVMKSPACRAANKDLSVGGESLLNDPGNENTLKLSNIKIMAESNEVAIQHSEIQNAENSWLQDNCNCSNNNEMSETSTDRLNENSLSLNDGLLDGNPPLASCTTQSNATQPECLDIYTESGTTVNMASAMASTENSSLDPDSQVAD